jgi:hypothetical protein
VPGVAGLIVLVALAGAVVLGLLCLGLWRRLAALGRELGELGERLEQARGPEPPEGHDLEHDLAGLRRKYPGVRLDVRRPGDGGPGA